MSKRTLSPSSAKPPAKRLRMAPEFRPNKISTFENAAKVDADPPLEKLTKALKDGVKNPRKGEAVVHWMRMADLRITDNRALSRASKQARQDNIPLLVMFVLSPQDYQAHDRSARRIDFTLRNLSSVKHALGELSVPLFTATHSPRRTLPEYVVTMLNQWRVKKLYANIEYEVDELRRDTKICELAKDYGIQCNFVHDKLLVEPGMVKTQQGKPYAVFSPFHRSWIDALNKHLEWIVEAPVPESNDPSVRSDPTYSSLFDSAVPDHVAGFECKEKELMTTVWPAGNDSAKKILARFLDTKSRKGQLGPVSPLSDGAERSEKKARAQVYKLDRDRADSDTTSRLSPYLSAGVISSRELVRATMLILGIKSVQSNRDTNIGMWVQEIAWRDFYSHVLVAFPRVSMGRPYQEKFADVKWETNEEHLNAWKEGRTGVPIVDAGMRQLNKMGWMHNRLRMVTAMYLTKDLMLDWRLGEKYFMENLMDGDLASNNGGWQWSASTGVDPQPYFRIFNPYRQSEKADPTGDYIREFVPELAKCRGKDLHEPSGNVADKLGYPRPLVDHSESRLRAIRRYKNPGEE